MLLDSTKKELKIAERELKSLENCINDFINSLRNRCSQSHIEEIISSLATRTGEIVIGLQPISQQILELKNEIEKIRKSAGKNREFIDLRIKIEKSKEELSTKIKDFTDKELSRERTK